MNLDLYLSRIAHSFAQVMKLISGGSDANSLSGRAAQSGVWIGGGFVMQRVLQFGSNLILTRLLFPEAFGLMALSTVFLVGLAMFSDLGLKPAMIRDPRGNEPIFLNTAWTIQAIRGFVLFIIGCLLAYPISLLYDQPILLPLLTVLSTTAAIAGFTSVKMVTAERDLDFRSVTFIQIAGQAMTIMVMIALAYSWRSVWSLAIGNIVGSLTTVVLSHLILRGHAHRFQLEPASAKSLVHFGKWIFLSTIVTFLGGEGLKAIQGGFITPAEFGILAIAYTIAAIPIELSIKLTGLIGLPALAETFRNDPTNVKEVLRKFRKRVLVLSFVLVTAVVLLSEIVVEALYDTRYHSAGPFVVAITLANAISLISTGYNNVILAIGQSRSYLFIMTLLAAARIVGTIAGFQCFGLLGMIVGVGIGNVGTLIVSWPLMNRLRLLDLKLDLISLLYLTIVTSSVMYIF